MNYYIQRVFALSALVTLCPLVFGLAQDIEQPLTLREAIKLALERNPEILVAQEQYEELKGRIQEVRSEAYPQISLRGYGLRFRDPSILNSSSFDQVPPDFRDALVPRAANIFDLGMRLTQPIYTAGKLGKAIRLAEESLMEKEASQETVRQLLSFKVFQAFHDLLLAQANQTVVLETYQQRQRHLEQARNRFSSGVATEIDVLRSEVNVKNLEPELIRAENQIRLARSMLNNLIVVDLDADTQIADSLEYHPWPMDSLEEIQHRSLMSRPELQEASRQLEQARLMLSLADAENKLSVDFEAGFGYAVREPKNLFIYNFSRWNLTFNFNIPFYDGGRKAGLVAQALARVRAAEYGIAQIENNVRLEVKAAYDDMQAAAKAIDAASLSVRQADKVLTMMQANYQYGAATTLDVVDSQTALAVARNSHIGAIYDYEMAKARLRLASGSPITDQEVSRQ